jgi:hypothetical protein
LDTSGLRERRLWAREEGWAVRAALVDGTFARELGEPPAPLAGAACS